MNIKSKFIISACVFVLLICVSLNIVLLCTPVFGTYSHTYNDGSHATFTFYENTYTYVAYDSNGIILTMPQISIFTCRTEHQILMKIFYCSETQLICETAY